MSIDDYLNNEQYKFMLNKIRQWNRARYRWK